MGYKTILVHVDQDPRLKDRLTVAARLARQWNSEVIGLHISPALDDLYAPTPVIAEMIRSARSAAATSTAERLAVYTRHILADEGIALEWRSVTGDAVDHLTLQARYADLTLLGQTPEQTYDGLIADLPERVILSAGGPVLVVPYAGGTQIFGKRILLAWNASRESARAAADALPFLQTAERVFVATVIEGADLADRQGEEVSAAMALRLARHGVKAVAATVLQRDLDAPNALLNYGAEIGADMVVLGCYGHSRLREHLFGGMTRELLVQMPMPVLMAH